MSDREETLGKLMCITTIIDSKKLIERGIPNKTADYVWIPESGTFVLKPIEESELGIDYWIASEGAIPAWSTDRLLDLLPREISDYIYHYRLVIKKLADKYNLYEVTYRAYSKVGDEDQEIQDGENFSIWIGSGNVSLYEGALELVLVLTLQQEGPYYKSMMKEIEEIYGETI